jgi:hypothetical protein
VKLRQSDEIYTPINFDYLRHPLDRRLGDPWKIVNAVAKTKMFSPPGIEFRPSSP